MVEVSLNIRLMLQGAKKTLSDQLGLRQLTRCNIINGQDKCNSRAFDNKKSIF